MAAGALQGTIAIVTGGGSGIGRATTGRCAAEGASVAVAAFLTGVVLPVDGGRSL